MPRVAGEKGELTILKQSWVEPGPGKALERENKSAKVVSFNQGSFELTNLSLNKRICTSTPPNISLGEFFFEKGWEKGDYFTAGTTKGGET